jgi:hypothetical protein
VVQVLIRKPTVFEYAQGVFVESALGNGETQAAGEAGRVVDCSPGAGVGAVASVLPEAERVAVSGGLRRVCREPVCEVLCGAVRSAVTDAGHLLPLAADRVLRRHRPHLLVESNRQKKHNRQQKLAILPIVG